MFIIALFIVAALTFIFTMAYYEIRINRLNDKHMLVNNEVWANRYWAGWKDGRENMHQMRELYKDLSVKLDKD